MIGRRQFITLLCGAAAWPIVAGAQQGERVRRIGVLAARSADDPEWQARMAAFRQGLQELGWIVGRTIEIEHRVGPDDNEFLRRSAAELVALAPDAIVAVAGESIPVHADMSIVIPPHTPHGYKNSSDGILRMIASLADPDAVLGKRV